MICMILKFVLFCFSLLSPVFLLFSLSKAPLSLPLTEAVKAVVAVILVAPVGIIIMIVRVVIEKITIVVVTQTVITMPVGLMQTH